MKYYALLLCCFVGLNYSTCKKSGIGCGDAKYNFEGRATIQNAMDSLTLGDTVWLDIKVPVSQIDNSSNRQIEFRRAVNLGTAIGLGELVSTGAIDAAKDFDYYLTLGSPVSNPNTNAIREFLFFETANDYEFHLGIIPKKRGIFSIGISNADNVYLRNDNCSKAFYQIGFFDTNQHLYLIKEAYGVEPKPNNKTTYCFKVN